MKIIKTFLFGICLIPVISSALLAQSVRQKINFDNTWKFHLGNVHGAQNPFFNDQDWRTLDLPHDWSIEGSFSPKNVSSTAYLPGGIGWYRKTFTLPKSAKGKHCVIQFSGIYDNSKVWINGHYLGNRPYGFISFYYNLSPYLNYGNKKNVIAVKVDHSDIADSRWYTGSGIYRHVWLYITNLVHVAHWGTFVTTPQVNKDSAIVQIVTHIVNESKEVRRIKLESVINRNSHAPLNQVASTITLAANSETSIKQKLKVEEPSLWSPEHPFLYQVKSRLMENGRLVDNYITPFGIRTIKFDANKGFILNGKPVKIKGVCLHGDAGPLGTAVPDAEWVHRLKLLKEAGVNAIRTSHNPKSSVFMDLCDKMGFLVMDEAFDEWKLGKPKWIKGRNVGQSLGAAGLGKYFSLHGYSDYFTKWADKDIKSMVKRDRNHPSVILWSIGNEIDYPNQPYTDPDKSNYEPWRPNAYQMTDIARRLYNDVKEVDTTRPVTAALADIPLSNKIGYASLLDVVGYNYQGQLYKHDHKKFPDRKIFGSETSHSYRAWLYVKDNSFVAGQFIWTGFDYLGEAGRFPNRSNSAGLITINDFKKPAFYFRKSLWTDKPMVYLAVIKPDSSSQEHYHRIVRESWNWGGYNGKMVTVIAYTNCSKVELLLNGKKEGERYLAKSKNHILRWRIPYHPGMLKAIGYRNGKKVCSWNLATAGEPDHIMLKANRDTIKANGRDISYVKVYVVDKKGRIVPDADNNISFKINGPGENIGVANADPDDLESFKANHHKVYHGKGSIIIQSTGKKGNIRLKAISDHLKTGNLTVTAE
jgi:beta-galactosidase/beta-glucuronidase